MAYNKTLEYSQLKNEVMSKVSAAILEGGEDGAESGFNKLYKEIENKLNSKNIKFNANDLKKSLQQQIDKAISGININPKFETLKGISISNLVNMDEDSLFDRIADSYDKMQEETLSENAIKRWQDKFVAAVTVAKNRGIEIFGEYVSEYNNLMTKLDEGANTVDSRQVNFVKKINEAMSSTGENYQLLDVIKEVISEIDIADNSSNDLKATLRDLLSKFTTTSQAKNFKNLTESITNTNNGLKELLKSYGLLNKEGSISPITDGANNLGGIIGKDKVALVRQISENSNPQNTRELKAALDEAYAAGVNCSRILDVIEDKQNNIYMEIQETAKGGVLQTFSQSGENIINTDVLKATDEQIDKLISDFKTLYNLGIQLDPENLSNILYDVNKGFSFIDLDLGGINPFNSAEEMIEAFITSFKYQADDLREELHKPIEADAWDKLSNKIEVSAKGLVTAATTAVQTAQDSHSPSKVAEELGKDFADGYAKGIKEKAAEVQKAAEELISTATENTKEDTTSLKSKLNGISAGKLSSTSKPLYDILGVNKGEIQELDASIESLFKKFKNGEITKSKLTNDIWKAYNSAISEEQHKKKDQQPSVSVKEAEKELKAIKEESQVHKELIEVEKAETQIKVNNSQVEKIKEETSEVKKEIEAKKDLATVNSEINDTTHSNDRTKLNVASDVDELENLKKIIASTTAEIDKLQETIGKYNASPLQKYADVFDQFGNKDYEFAWKQAIESAEKWAKAQNLGDKEAQQKYFDKASVYYGLYSSYRPQGEQKRPIDYNGKNIASDFLKRYRELVDEYNNTDINALQKEVKDLIIKRGALADTYKVKSELQRQEKESVRRARETSSKKDTSIQSNDTSEIEKENKKIFDSIPIQDEKLITVKFDTEIFNKQISEINNKLDSIQDKTINLDIDNFRIDSNSLGNIIQGWSDAVKQTGRVSNERYTVANSQSGYVANSYLEGEAEAVELSFIKKLINTTEETVDTVIHSHPKENAAFSDDDIKSAFKLLKEGINKQIVAATNDVMSIDFSKVDKSKANEILLSVKDKYEEIDSYIAQSFMNKCVNKDFFVQAVTNATSNDLLGQQIREEFENGYDDFFNSIDKSTISTLEKYYGCIQKYLTNILVNHSDKTLSKITELNLANFNFQEELDARFQDYADNVFNQQKLYQEALVSIFSSKNFLKKGESTAISVDSIENFAVKNNKNLSSQSVEIDIVPNNIERFVDTLKTRLSQENFDINLELANLDEIIQKIKARLNTIFEKNDIDVSSEKVLPTNTNSSSSEATTEVSKLQPLSSILDEIIQKIKTKTEEFSKERQTVEEEVPKEVIVLQDLITSLEKIKTTIDAISVSKIDFQGLTNVDFDKIEDDFFELFDAYELFVEEFNKLQLDNSNFVSLIQQLSNMSTTILQAAQQLQNAVNIFNNMPANPVPNGNNPNGNNNNPNGNGNNNNKSLRAYGNAFVRLSGKNAMNVGAVENLKEITSNLNEHTVAKNYSSLQRYFDAYLSRSRQQMGAWITSKNVSKYVQDEVKYFLQNTLETQIRSVTSQLSNISLDNLNNLIQSEILDSIETFINTTYNSDRFKAADQTSVSGINQKMTKFLAENSMSSDDKTILNNLISATSKGASLDQSQLKDIVTEFNRIQASSENANNSVSAFFKLASKYTADYARQFMQQYLSLYDFIRYFREAVSAVEELDTALTELKVVSNASSSQLKNVSSSAYNIAQELGSSTTEIVESITDWRRLGESIEDATTLAEQSSILSTGGFMEVDTATEALTSSMQAFGYSAENASDMVDQFIYLGNNYAITSEDLATSLEKSSAAMVAAGNSFEQTEALEIAGNTIMQDSDSVANALKTVSMRLRGTTASALEDAGEDTEGLIEDASKLYKTVKELTTTASNPNGVSIINEATGAYKSTYEILLEISKVYNQLSDAQQASLLETIAGKTRGSAVAAILQSGDILESAYTDAMENATGAGDDALEASMDSIEKKVAQFTNSLKNLANDSLDSSLLKSIVDFDTKIINIIDKVSNSPLGSVGLIGAIIGGTAGLTGKSAANLKNGKEWLAKIDKGFHGDGQSSTQGSINEGLSAIASPITGVFSNIGDYLTDSIYSGNGWTFGEKEYQDIQNYNNSLTTLRGNLKSQTITQEEYNHQLNTLRNSLDDSTASVRNYASQLRTGEANINDLTQTTRLAQFAQAGFNAALNVGISLLISAAVTAISKLITAEQDFADATQAAGEEMKTLTDSFDDYESQVESLRETLDDTTSSFEDQVSARESLYNIQEQLIETYGSEAESIDLITTSADEAAQALDTLYQKQLEKEIRDYNEENDGVFSSIARGGKTASEAAEDKIDNNKTVLYDALAAGLSDDDKSYISTFIHDTYGDIASIREGGLSFNGSAYENLEALEGIYSAISSTLDTSDKGVSDFLDNLQTGISKVEDTIDSYGDVVDTQTLLDIYNDEDAKSYYDQLALYYNQYKEAVTEGDTETSDSRKEQFLSLFDTMSKDGNIDESIVSYIERLYPTLQAEISQWEFKVAITADTNGIYTQIKDFLTDEAVFGGMDVDQIETAGKTGTSSEQNAYQYLLEQASAFGFSTVKEMLEYLNTIGVVTVHTSEDTQAISNIDNTLNNQGKEFTDDTYSSTSDWYDSKDSEYQAVVQTEEYSAALEELTSKSDKAAVSQKDLEKAYKKAYAALHEGDEKSFSSLMDGAQQTIDKFSTLTDVYEDVSDGDDFDWSSILNNDDFDEQFSEFTDTYEDFIQTITENPTDIKKCQDAFDNLATDWFYSSDMLSNLTEENKKAWVTMAKQSGIANAQTLATNYLAAASEYAATAQEHLNEEVNGVTITTTDLTEATESEIAALMNEGTMSESTSKYLLSYYIEKLKAAGLTIDTSGDVANLSALMTALGLSTKSLTAYYVAKSQASKYAQDAASFEAAAAKETDPEKKKNILAKADKYNGLAASSSAEAASELSKTQTQITSVKMDNKNKVEVTTPTSSSNNNSSSDKNGSGSDSSSSDDAETIDWIEVKLNRLSDTIDKLDQRASRTWSGWTSRTKVLNKEIKKLSTEIKTLKKASTYYKKYATDVKSRLTDAGLKTSKGNVSKAKHINKLIKSGKINISDYSGKWADYIQNVQDYWEKGLDADSSLLDAQDTQMEKRLEKIDNIQTRYENLNDIWDARADYLESSAKDSVEDSGHTMTNKQLDSYYTKLNQYNKKKIATSQNEYDAIKKQYDYLINKGLIAKNSEEAKSLEKTLLELQTDIQDTENAIAENTIALNEAKWDNVKNGVDYLNDQIEHNNFIIDLMGYQDTEENHLDTYGNINDYGQAVQAIHLSNIEGYTQSLSYLSNAIDDIKSKLADDPTNTTYISDLEEMTSQYEEQIKAIYEERDAIIDLIQNAYDAQLSYMQELIDAYEEMLDSQKSLYDYQKNIKEKTDTVATYEKQLAAIEGDNSEEAKSRRQQIQNSLKDAQEDLEETEYEQFISDQKDMLQTLYDDTTDYFDVQIADVDARIEDTTKAVEEASDTINKTLTDAIGDHNLETDTITTLFGETDSVFYKRIDQILSTYSNASADGTDNSADSTSTNNGGTSSVGTEAKDNKQVISDTLSMYQTEVSKTHDAYEKDTSNSSLKALYNDARLRYAATFIAANAKTTTKKESELPYINKRIYAYTGGKILTRPNMEALFNVLKQKSTSKWDGNTDGGNLATLLKAIGLSGFARGGVVSDDAVNLSDLGLRASNGDTKLVMAQSGERILTPAQNEAYEQLGQALLGVDTSTLTDAINFTSKLPEISSTSAGNTITSNVETMTLSFPNVTNYEEFISKMKNDSSMEKWLQAVTLGQAMGQNSLTKRRY